MSIFRRFAHPRITSNRHLSKITLEPDGIYVCSNWLGNDINGQNSDGTQFCALIELYLTRLEIALFKFQGLHFSPPYGELYRTSCPFA